MHIFALRKIEQVKGKVSFYKLEIDGKCEFDGAIKNEYEKSKKQ